MAGVFCPYGNYGYFLGASLPCESQATLVIMFCLVLPLCCISICLWRQRKCFSTCCAKPFSDGNYHCGEYGQQLPFTIVKKEPERTEASTKPSHLMSALNVSTEPPTLLGQLNPRGSEQTKAPKTNDGEPVLASSQEAVGDVEQGESQEEVDQLATLPRAKSRISNASQWSMLTTSQKVHVVWDVNLAHALAWLSGKTTEAPAFQPKKQKKRGFFAPWRRRNVEEAPDAPEPEGSIPHEGAQEEVPSAPPRESTFDSAQELSTSKVHPAYSSSERAEYFSATHGTWMMGQVSVKLGRSATGLCTAAYSVALHHTGKAKSQVRSNVELSSLRPFLEAGNPCELWDAELKQWLPGTVQSLEARGGPLRYYQVRLNHGSALHRAEASEVRHAYPPKSHVLVYNGLEHGWVPAEVSGDGGSTEHEASTTEMGERDGDAVVPQKVAHSLSDYVVMVRVAESPLEASYQVPSNLLRWEGYEAEVQHITTDGTVSI